MKCPVCKDVTLLMSEKHGVEIDYCPECRGIWLDRGELEKIIERSGNYKNQNLILIIMIHTKILLTINAKEKRI
ncbi:zf-TFIIB domain-containing protein [Coprobacillaceae bacterium CR2/5/TPMF4]|nr:zf-TFIIB domain-containing protein [Coprobacillaceae bacterium CR2/5/TPMF4]